MHIEKRGNSYRIEQMYKGKRYRVSVDHKPTKEEAIKLLANIMGKETIPLKSSLSAACDSYIAAKDNVLSPSTVAGYRSIIRRLPQDLLNKPITQISSRDIQVFVNKYSVGRTPKSVLNVSNFVMTVLAFHGIKLDSPKLPQKVKKEVYTPTEEDIQKILDKAKGTKYEVPLTLAAFGMRRSEIISVTSDKLNGTTLTIDTATVQNEKYEWVEKTTKTTASTRTIVIPQRIADIIKEQGKAYTGSAETLNNVLHRYQDALKIPRFPLHKMRHFFASYLHQKGYSDAQIQAMGGWSTDNVMKSVYRHAMELDSAKNQACADIESIISPKEPNSQ